MSNHTQIHTCTRTYMHMHTHIKGLAKIGAQQMAVVITAAR